MSQAHAPFCTEHEEGICRAPDVVAGKWEIGLSDDGTAAVIYVAHPEIAPAVEQNAMSAEEAVELGQALLLQGMRGLAGRR